MSQSSTLEAAVPVLSFDRTVPRTAVHRAAVSEVFLTDSIPVGADKFLVAAHLPRMHAFFDDRPSAGSYDPLLCIETSRQACVLVAHRYFGVPETSPFVFRHGRFELIDADALVVGLPANPIITVSVEQVQPSRGVPNVIDLSLDFAIDGASALRFRGGLLALPRSAYRQMRRAGMERAAAVQASWPGEPVRPEDVGRVNPRNVVLSESAAARAAAVLGTVSATLLVDQTHPVFFDHPLDHVPGMLLIEAHRQAAVLAASRTLGWESARVTMTAIEVGFDDFVELGVRTPVQAALIGVSAAAMRSVTVATTITQADRVVSTAEVRLSR